MIDRLAYNPKHDYLMHVGDLIAKGPNPSEVISSMSKTNITGVRGNHDQKVIEWRAWIEWVQSHKGGRAWLRDLENKYDIGGESAIEKMKKEKGKKWKIPDGWMFGKEHYRIAR
jgi:predicted phosphodiesterase